jgi:hypothetical protein
LQAKHALITVRAQSKNPLFLARLGALLLKFLPGAMGANRVAVRTKVDLISVGLQRLPVTGGDELSCRVYAVTRNVSRLSTLHFVEA